MAIVRLRHGPHKFALHAIPLINNVGERSVETKILYVGATLKHCFLFIRVSNVACPSSCVRYQIHDIKLLFCFSQKYQERKLEQLWSKLPTEAERKRMETLLMTLTPATKDLT